MSKVKSALTPQTLSGLPEVVTPEQLAAALDVHPNVIRRLCAKGSMPAVKVGSKWCIGRDRLLEDIMPKRRRVIAKRIVRRDRYEQK